MTHHLVFTQGGGQLGNQLINYANLLAFRLEYPEYRVIDLAFRQYQSDYDRRDLELTELPKASSGLWGSLLQLFWGDHLLKTPVIDSLLHSSRLRLFHGLASYRQNAQSIVAGSPHISSPIPGDKLEGLNLTDPHDSDRLRSKSISVIAGWNVRAWPLVEQHHDVIQQHLQPGNKRTEKVEDYVDSLRDEYELLVGVHMRQGDYCDWRDGEYYFSSAEYRKMADAFADQSSDETIGFLIASDESQDNSLFEDDRYHLGVGDQDEADHYVEDFVKLSCCDIVLAPPSTFSAFATFLGDVPLVPLFEGVIEEGFQELERPLLDSISHPIMSAAIK